MRSVIGYTRDGGFDTPERVFGNDHVAGVELRGVGHCVHRGIGCYSDRRGADGEIITDRW